MCQAVPGDAAMEVKRGKGVYKTTSAVEAVRQVEVYLCNVITRLERKRDSQAAEAENQ